MAITKRSKQKDLKRYKKIYNTSSSYADKKFFKAGIDYLKGERNTSISPEMKRVHNLLSQVAKHKQITQIAREIGESKDRLYHIHNCQKRSAEICNKISRKLKKHYPEIKS